jgi:hypothetical protein
MAAKAEQSTDAGERRLLRVLGLTEAVCRLWLLILTQVIQVSYDSVHGI